MSAERVVIMRVVVEAVDEARGPVPDEELPGRSGLAYRLCQLGIRAAEQSGYVSWSLSPEGWSLLAAGERCVAAWHR